MCNGNAHMKNNMMKKLFFMTAFIVGLFLLSRVVPLAYESGLEDGGLDVVIVIDTSGSMKQTDSDRIAIEAAKLFIDMMETSGSKVALVPFSDKVGKIVSMTEINSQSDKADIKTYINTLVYDGDTDIGLALKQVYDILNQNKNTQNQQVILFFTDGKIDLSDNLERTEEQSMSDSLEVADLVGQENIPIYAIGLNSNGNVDQELITELTNKTNGKKYIVDSAEELPEIFNEIFANFISSNIISLGDFKIDNVNFTEIPFTIPNNSVLEANLIILSDDTAVEEIQLINSRNEDVTFNTNYVVIESSQRYTLLKLFMPDIGDWKLRVRGEECKIHINLIFNYKVVLKCSAEIISNEKEKYIDVIAWMEKEETKIQDSILYQAFSGKLYLTTVSGVEVYEMITEEDHFHGVIPIETMMDEYNLYAQIESESMYRKSQVVTITIENSAPDIIGISDEIKLKGLIASFGRKKFDITECIIDRDEGETIILNVVSDDEEIVSAKIEKNEIAFYPKENGVTKVEITATDSRGAEARKTVQIVVDYRLNSIFPIIISLLLVIMIVILLVILKKKYIYYKCPFYGRVEWMLVGNRNSQQGHSLNYEKGCLAVGTFIIGLEASEMNLQKVVIHMNKNNDGIKVVNRSTKCQMLCGFGSPSVTETEIRDKEFVLLSGQYAGKEILMQLTYFVR